MAKTGSQSNPIPRSFTVKSPSQLVICQRTGCFVQYGRSSYLDVTKGMSPRSQLLFVSPRRPSRPISKNAASFFLKETISGAGATSPHEGQGLRAHSIRGMNTTVSFYMNKNIKGIRVKANNVFSSFYLKDINHI